MEAGDSDFMDIAPRSRITLEIQLRNDYMRGMAKNADILQGKTPTDVVWKFLGNHKELKANTVIYADDYGDDLLKSLVESFVICDGNPEEIVGDYQNWRWSFYTAKSAGPEAEPLCGSDGESDGVTASNHWILPSREFIGLWENLIYEPGIKEKILNYMETSMVFAKKRINTNLICCNRIVLLHGPPGMGKTSLCRALAQKFSIRFQDKYKYFHLVEINSHSLFSKWFSESGKLVQQLFTQLREIVEDPTAMVCILIDEIESVAFARSSLSNNEPSDSVRAVNAVLTQLDQIRKYPNVIILATSNLTSNIDVAFLDRADIKQFIGPPTEAAIVSIYKTIFNELVRVGLAVSDPQTAFLLNDNITNERFVDFDVLITLSQGVSGRTLRKIPMIAHAYFLVHKNYTDTIPLSDFITAMVLAMKKYLEDTKMVNKTVEL